MALTKVTSGVISSDASSIDLNIDAGTLYIDASANKVGIQTTSPDTPLDVEGSGGIRVNEDGSGTKVINLRSDFAGVGPAVNVSSNHPLLLMTNNTERVRVDSSGNVGVDVASTTAKLGVKNATNDSTYTNRQYAVFSHTGTYEDSDLGALVGTGFGELQINAAQGDRPPVLSLGGTLNAGELLGMINFYRSSNTDTYRCRAGIIAAGNNTGTANQYGGQLRFVTAADGGTNPSERMRIIQDGTVAIGTTISSNYGGGSLVVSSNNNFGITVGVNANNGYRTYRHVYSSGVHEFSSSANTASLSNAGAWTNASDRAYKKDIVDTQYGLDTILNLQPRDFTIKADESSDTGFIAQELETVLPQFVIGEEGHKNVNYAQITAVLTKAVQELKTELDAAKARIETLENA